MWAITLLDVRPESESLIAQKKELLAVCYYANKTFVQAYLHSTKEALNWRQTVYFDRRTEESLKILMKKSTRWPSSIEPPSPNNAIKAVLGTNYAGHAPEKQLQNSFDVPQKIIFAISFSRSLNDRYLIIRELCKMMPQLSRTDSSARFDTHLACFTITTTQQQQKSKTSITKSEEQ